MILRSSPASPFGRKVKMTAILLGLIDKIEITRTDVQNSADPIFGENPLGKIPALILKDGTCLYDSRVICEYLNNLGGGSLFPSGDEGWNARTMQALCDGILDAAILRVYEKRYRPEDKRHPDWVQRQQDKVERGLKWLEDNTPAQGGSLTIGDVCLACVLGYLDFRFEGKWRDGHPNQVAWLEAFAAANPAYDATKPSD